MDNEHAGTQLNIIHQNILKVKSGLIVHQVNMLGVMGGGLALQIKNKWPVVYMRYADAIKKEIVALGDVQIVRVTTDLWVANIFGQQGVGGTSPETSTSIDALERAFTKLSKLTELGNIYLPYGLGCGLGGGNWANVSELIERHLPQAIICRL